MANKQPYYAKPWIEKDARMKAVKEYLSGVSPQRVAKKLGVHYTTIYAWTRKMYKSARNGIKITPRLRDRYAVKPYKKKIAYKMNRNGVMSNSNVPKQQPKQQSTDNKITTSNDSNTIAELKDIKIAGNFELVEGKAYATDIVVNLGNATSFKLTKDTIKLLNDLGTKLL